MSYLDKANALLNSIRKSFTSKDRKWIFPAIGASLFVFAAYTASKLKCRRHDNIPPVAPQDFGFTGHGATIASLPYIHDWLYESIKAMGFPQVASMAIPGQHYIMISDPKLVKFCLESNFDYCQRAEKQCEEFYPLLGQGIFASNGERWKFHRKVASRMFSMRNLKDFMYSKSREHVLSTLDKMEQLLTTSNTIDVNDILGRFTFDTFCHIAFGVDMNSVGMYPETHKFGSCFDALIQGIDWRTQDPLWKWKRMFNVGNEADIKENSAHLAEVVYGILDAKKRGASSSLVDADSGGKLDLLSLFLKHNPDLTREQLKDIAMNFIIAGRDTTRMLLTWCLYALSMKKHQDILSKLCEEIDSYDSEPEYGEFVSGFRYLEGVLCETLRIWPPVPFIGRAAMLDFEIPTDNGKGGKHVIRKGDLVMSSCYVSGRNPKIWGDDCLEFKPERWAKKGINSYDQYSFMSFNINPRLCLGKQFAMTEAKLFMYHFMKRFTFERDETREIEIKNGVILNVQEMLLSMKVRK